MLLSLAIWIQNLQFFTYLRSSGEVYPAILALHLSAISLFGAMIVATDLRLLGWAFRGSSIAAVVDQLRIPKRIGFLLAATCGFLLFCSKAEDYYYNPFFRMKISLFILVGVHALVFRPSVYNHPAALDGPSGAPVRAKVAATISLFLWICILCAGRSIGYVPSQPDEFRHYL
jgi:uncharacterized membrane protein